MSLNGLEDQKIKEAYDTAVAEPGGWFLLKYVARDEIDLLGRGNGGIVEIRNAIAQYEEPSPLFGFLRYRRRNVLIKYVPEECSRLVQARVTVHFNAVTERFSPHDTIFPITTSKELRDTTLSAACSLHTASGSTSSSTSSLRRRRLMEIAEDEEEDLRTKRQSTVPEERPSTAKTTSVSGAPPTVDLPELPVGLGLTSSISNQSSETDGFPPPREVRPPSPSRSAAEPRKSSQSTRPELSSYSSYGSSGRPKVKLGPRPSLDVVGRPHTSGASSYYRPVSTLPAGVKVLGRGGSQKDKPRTIFTADNSYATVPPPPKSPPPHPELALTPSQDALVRPHTSGGTSASSMKPLISPAAPTFPRIPTITPERARLLKAMEMRKKYLKSTPDPASLSPNTHTEESIISNGEDSSHPEIEESSPILDDATKGDDSGIAFDASSILKTDGSDATRSDSYPVSPIGPSERAESTRASSISDSTDETVHERHIPKPIGKVDSADEKVTDQDAIPAQIVESSNENLAKVTSPDIKRESLQKLLPTVYNPFADVGATEATPAVLEIQEEIEQENVPISISENESARLPTRYDPFAYTPPSASENDLTAKTTSKEIYTSADEAKIEQASKELSVHVQAPMEEAAIEAHSENVLGPSSPGKTWRVPRSKFSVQDLRVEQDAPNIPTEPLPLFSSHTTIPAPEPSPIESTFSVDTKKSVGEDVHGPRSSSKRKKRRGLVDPIRTDFYAGIGSGPNSDSNISSDEDLMDELQSAVFQEAKPISVSKSPLSPVFPTTQNHNGEQKFSRAFPQPFRKETSDPQVLTTKSSQTQSGPPRSVSASAAYLDRIAQQQAKPTPKKVNLGSGISQRIKALEKFSSLAPGATPPSTAPSSRASTAFFSVKKSSIRSPSKSPSIAERANSLRNDPSPSISRESSPEAVKIRERSGSVKSRLEAFSSNEAPTKQPNRARPETISVTARIIRDPAQPFPAISEAGKDPADYAPLDLKQSPLVIEHQKAVTDPQKETIQERRLSKERRLSNASKSTSKERRSSPTVIKDLINDGRASLSERRRSINLEPSILSPNRSTSRPPSVHQSPANQRPASVSSRRNSRDLASGFSPPPTDGSISSTGDDKSETKSTRASRMLRRLSSSLSASRKTIAHAMSPTVREEFEPVNGVDAQSLEFSQPLNTPATPNIVSMGDVNCQFPDSLLWKRRSLVIDSAGYLVLSPALTAHGTGAGKDKTVGQAIRRFHMSEFRTPTIPDADMEELPNSVVLDFIEGGGLQVACEDRAGQGRILKILQETHRVWATYGQ